MKVKLLILFGVIVVLFGCFIFFFGFRMIFPKNARTNEDIDVSEVFLN